MVTFFLRYELEIMASKPNKEKHYIYIYIHIYIDSLHKHNIKKQYYKKR